MGALVAILLILFSEFLLQFFGLTQFDPFTTRLLGAAFVAIGVSSLIHRNADINVYKSLLNLKIIWSSTAIFGTLLTIWQTGNSLGWIVVAIFGAFLLRWSYYRVTL